MFTWIAENIGTILVTLALCAVVIGSVAVMKRDKKNGKSSCGGSCGHCPMGGSCHNR